MTKKDTETIVKARKTASAAKVTRRATLVPPPRTERSAATRASLSAREFYKGLRDVILSEFGQDLNDLREAGNNYSRDLEEMVQSQFEKTKRQYIEYLIAYVVGSTIEMKTSPPLNVDLLWHAHLLETASYRKLEKTLIEKFNVLRGEDNKIDLEYIDHSVVKKTEVRTERLKITENLFSTVLGFDAFDANEEVTLAQWRDASIAHFDSIGKDFTMVASKEETVNIKLPLHFVLQDFFEERSESEIEQNFETSSFLFRELKQGHSSERVKDLSYKLLLKWNVEYGAVDYESTSQFISEFCMQLGDLSVMLPFRSEVKYNIQNAEGGNDWKTNLLVPLKGSKVMYAGEMMTVTKYSKETGMADLSYGDDGTQFFEVQRKDFVVKTIPVKIFDSTAGGSIPERDEWFSDSYDMYVARKFTPSMEKKDFEKKARVYFRAIGRFLSHVIYHGNNRIPTSVLPELYRNVLLRNCEPGSDEYDDSDVLEHFMNLDKGAMKKGNNRFYGLPFEVFEIDKEGVINEDNFIKEFVPAYMIESRKKNINALREGLTLGGVFPVDRILACQPLQVISQQFFSNNIFLVEHLIALLRPYCDVEVDEGRAKENHDRFIKETMPEALRTLARKYPSFLPDFVFFVSGSRCIPFTQGMLDFNISIFFDMSTGENHLPSCHTCENLICVPWGVYDNDVQVFAEKLETAVEFFVKY